MFNFALKKKGKGKILALFLLAFPSWLILTGLKELVLDRFPVLESPVIMVIVGVSLMVFICYAVDLKNVK